MNWYWIAIIAGAVLAMGVFKLFRKNVQRWVGFGLLAVGVIGVAGLSLPSIGDSLTSQTTLTGDLTVRLHDGLVNATTTSDYLNDDEDVMTFYSVDANIIDGQEIAFNATITRSAIAEDANVKVTCSIPDKELSGVTADNLAEKTSGKIDLDIEDGGTHIDDNTVYYYVAFAEGDGEENVQIAFDQEETYHDGMTDMDDYVTVACDADGVPFSAIVYANS